MKVLKKHLKERPVVLDPFCGRGTTLFAARNFKLNVWGIDSSPVAVAIAKAKLASCEIDAPLEMAATLIAETDPREVPESRFFRAAYHPRTLRDICALRQALLQVGTESDTSVILRAAALGCLHGPVPKNIQNAGYFSNQMPRTYAPKPDYAVRYWKESGLKASRIDVLRVLRRKIGRLIGLEKQSPNSFAQVMQGDARSGDVFRMIGAAPSIIITSPPYYGMRTYIQDQWLRNWFLGGPDYLDYSAGTQLDHGGKETFSRSLGNVWRNVGELSSGNESLHMYVRFGSIPSVAVNDKEIFSNSLEESGTKWRLVSVRSARSADAGRRQATQMKKDSAAAVEFDFHVERI